MESSYLEDGKTGSVSDILQWTHPWDTIESGGALSQHVKQNYDIGLWRPKWLEKREEMKNKRSEYHGKRTGTDAGPICDIVTIPALTITTVEQEAREYPITELCWEELWLREM